MALMKNPPYFPSADLSAKMRSDMEEMMAKEAVAKDRRAKMDMYSKLLDAFGSVPDYSFGQPTVAEHTADLGAVIRQKIEHHENMIKSLQWFASHLSLDAPEEHLFVNRVILEGLRSLAERSNKL